jgi:dCMP deaminase
LAPVYAHACSGAASPSGTNLDACEAIHAEQNALLQCHDVFDIHTCYVTASPCVTCTKLLLNTGCQRIVFVEEYPQPEAGRLWKKSHRQWLHVSEVGHSE